MIKKANRPCPHCKEIAKDRSENPHHPFCSKKCQLIDLGDWFGESYTIPDREPLI